LLTHIVKQTHTSSIYWHGNLLSYSTPLSLLVKNVVFGQSYRFWEFAILFCSKSWVHHLVPFAKLMEECFLHLHFSICSVFDCLALSFAALQRQCNCKSQLHSPVPSSETSFEFSLLEEVRMSSHSDMLQAFHWPASV